MSANVGARAASGARIQGDDVQHLIVWYNVVKSQQRDSNVESIAIEAADTGNLDDLVILRSADKRDEYWQVKASVDAKTPLDEEYLMNTKKSKTSVLQKTHKSWLSLCERARPKLPLAVLATTKAINENDAVLSRRATFDSRIYEVIKNDATARDRWAKHLSVSEDDLLRFLENFEIRHGLTESDWEEKIRDIAGTVHIQADNQGIATGIKQVRDWVKTPRQTFTPADLEKTISELSLKLPQKSGLVVVQMLDHNSRSSQADASLDFVSLFDGDNPTNRRKLIDNSSRTDILRALSVIRNELRAGSIYEVEVDGPMRLPLWFLTGKLLGNTTGLAVMGRTSNGFWSSASEPALEADLVIETPVDIVTSAPIVVSISLATDITQDVDEYVASDLNNIPHVKISVGRTGSRGIIDSAHAQAIAFSIRNEMRALDRKYRPSEIHLFLAMPGPGALLIGHVWDRLPPTTTYWDMGRPGQYSEAFVIT